MSSARPSKPQTQFAAARRDSTEEAASDVEDLQIDSADDSAADASATPAAGGAAKKKRNKKKKKQAAAAAAAAAANKDRSAGDGILAMQNQRSMKRR